MPSIETAVPGALRFGLIGPGQIADERLIPALRAIPGGEFWSVLGRNLERSADFARKHGAKAPVAAHDTIESFLDDPKLDAVIIATPDRLHASQAVAAANAGKHIFLEKPMATSTLEAQQILEAARHAGVKLAVGYHLRFHAGHQKVHELLRQGKIGKLLHMRVSWTMKASASDWRAAAATGRWWSLGATGTHALDMVRWLMMPHCGEITELKSVLSNGTYGGPHDETAVLALRFASGATAQVVSSVVFRAPRVVEIYGTAGSIVCTETLGPRGTGTIMLGDQPVEFVAADPYAGELASFIACIRDNTEPPVNGGEGLANVRLLELAAPEAQAK